MSSWIRSRLHSRMLLHTAANPALHVEISSPLMDGIDIQIDVPAVLYKELANTRAAESSEMIRTRVVAARNVQLRRFYVTQLYPATCGHGELGEGQWIYISNMG